MNFEHPTKDEDEDEKPPLRERTRTPRKCWRVLNDDGDECEEVRYSSLGMEYHLIRDHGVSAE
jgi:hypothetical protein